MIPARGPQTVLFFVHLRMHEPDMPGVLFVRIVEKLSLSTGASREAPVDKCAPRHGAKGMVA